VLVAVTGFAVCGAIGPENSRTRAAVLLSLCTTTLQALW